MGTTQCAFLAYDNSGGDKVRTGIFPMNTEVFDIGNNYNNSTYIFTAPVKGIYTFSWQCFSNNPTAGRVYLVAGSKIFLVGGSYSFTVTIALNAGQTAYLTGNTWSPSYYASDGHNSFSGHLVREIP